jgi:nickel-dependent lactate racemase
MKVRLAYGKRGLEAMLPTGPEVSVIEPRYLPGLPDQEEALRRALRSPIGSPPLRELLRPGDRVGVVVSDITRATPYPLMLPVLLSELEGVSPERLTFFVATGTHRHNTEDELEAMLGPGIVGHYRIVQNDALDQGSHALVGESRSGNPIWIHRELLECRLRIATGFIEPHFFAGFSGGGKAIMPGLALLETIMCNHGPRHLDDPRATWGVTEGNPLWEEVREVAEMVGVSFLLNVTLNRDKELTGVFAGELGQAHARGCAFARDTTMVEVPEAFDIVLTSASGHPLDLNLYQAVKGMSAAAQVVRPGGSIIVAAECWDGIPEHGEYGGLLREARDLEELLGRIRTPGFQRQDMWQVQIQALICRKARVYVYSDGLTDEQIRAAHLIPCRSIEDTLAALLSEHEGEGRARIGVLPEGPLTIPYLRS